MPTSNWTTLPARAGRLNVHRLWRCFLLAWTSVLLILSTSWASTQEIRPSLRDRALQIGRHVVSSVGYRIASPVQLQVLGDSSDAVLGGFAEALSAAGHPPQVNELSGMAGTVISVRRSGASDGIGAGLDVRVEQLPARTVVYSRFWAEGSELTEEHPDGFLERVVVPLTVGVAAALIVYLFFTVRS